jgi:hypothetical protein
MGRWGDEEIGRGIDIQITPSPYHPISPSSAASDGSDLLSHENKITDSET